MEEQYTKPDAHRLRHTHEHAMYVHSARQVHTKCLSVVTSGEGLGIGMGWSQGTSALSGKVSLSFKNAFIDSFKWISAMSTNLIYI